MGTERTRNRWIQVVAGLFCLLQVTFAGAADVPEVIHYEGYLTNTQGIPLSDGNYSLTFKIYDTATGVSALWTESWTNQPVNRGRFRVFLGSKTPLTAAFFQQNPSTYLGITVGTDTEMLPRQRIASVPYALSSAGNSIPSGGIIMWSGPVNTIPAGWALCDGNNGTPDLRNRFVVGVGSAYANGATGGASQINLAHTHTINDHTHAGVDHLHSIQHQHYVSRVNDGTHNGDGRGLRTDGDYSGYTGWWPQETTMSGAADRDLRTGGASNRGMDSKLSATQSILPPYFALAYIMKL